MTYKLAAVQSFIAGFSDALWPGAFIYLISSPVIRKRAIQCCVLNGIIFLGSICLLRYIMMPLFIWILHIAGFSSYSTTWAEFAIDKLYKVIWVLPLYIFSFILNSLWYQDIAERAHTLYSRARLAQEKSTNTVAHRNVSHDKKCTESPSSSPTSDGFYSPLALKNEPFSFSSPSLNNNLGANNRHKSNNELSKSHKLLKKNKRSRGNILSNIRNTLNEEIYHCLFLIVFNVQILVLSKIGAMFSLIATGLEYQSIAQWFEYIGLCITFFLCSWQHSFLSFEYKWIIEGVPLKKRIKYFEERVPYFSGFGAPLTLMVIVAPSVISTGVYALAFPLFIIQAIESKPMDKKQNESLSILEDMHKKFKIKPVRVPIFATTKLFQAIIIWFCGTHFCCVRSVLICIQKCGKLFGI